MSAPQENDLDVDWGALRRRLDQACAAIARSDEVDPARDRTLLAERAARLAQPALASAPTDTYDAITFQLGPETCAIDAALVLNVFRLGSLALLPGAPAPIHGVTMWRGDVLTLLDLRGSLGISTAALTDLGRVIVVGRSRAAFGFLADRVTGVRVLRQEEIHPSNGHAERRSALVGGITSDALLVLDGQKVLNLATTGD